MRKYVVAGLLTVLGFFASAQPTQTIRGVVVDKESKEPLAGASVVLLGFTPQRGTLSQADGSFRLEKVPIGRQSIRISFVGYKPVTFQNLLLNSVKEMIVEAELEESVVTGSEIEVKASLHKEDPRNRMAVISARSFTVEETEKYAGSRGDVARMAMNYAGVSSSNDQRNDIVIRGNSPSGLLWRLEDVEIPNPNHFAENGTTGGPVGMLNNNLLENSDFLTGAFPAQYGNALSGVFDLNLRNGNNQKHEHLFQVGFNGFEAGTEGPFSKEHKSSYLANFRYSTLELMDGIVNLGTTGIPKYKDFSFKMNFPLKKGRITLFGLGGFSSISMLDSKRGNKQNMYSDEGQDLVNRSGMAVSALSYTAYLSERTRLKLILSGLYQSGGTTIDTLDVNSQPHSNIDHNYADYRATFSGYLNSKLSSRLTIKSGFSVDRMGFDLLTKQFSQSTQSMRAVLDDHKGIGQGITLFQPYFQMVYKFNNQLSLLPGIHFSYLDLNQSAALEPRISLAWQTSDKQKLTLGYGLHSRSQTLSTYFLGSRDAKGQLIETNRELGFTKSNQFVVGWDRSLSPQTRFKAEAYYQSLFNVPVEQRPTSFSILNTGANWGLNTEDSLVNKGTGRNYGVEFTLERFFAKNIYYLTTLSLFDSKYKGSDGTERNSAFNGNYVFNFLIGKEFPMKRNAAFNVDFKMSYAGGKRYTPIDLAASQAANTTKYDDTRAYSLQFPSFFKTDIKFGYRVDSRHVSQEWVFYIENLTNHDNFLMQWYSKSQNKAVNVNQLGFFPMMQYRLRF
ncbi:MAG: TonB-dependent receptor [Marinilabiliales bacterium]|nr:TonB-dependent receptor [Marinilabiliales bacterium]